MRYICFETPELPKLPPLVCSGRSHFSLVWQQTIMITVFSCLVNWFEKKLLLISDISYEETRQQHDLTRMLSVISIKVIIHKSCNEVSHSKFIYISKILFCFYTFILCNFLVWTLQFCPKNIIKLPSKLANNIIGYGPVRLGHSIS